MDVFRREPSAAEITSANEEIAQQELAISMLDQKLHALLAEMANIRRAQARHRDKVARCRGVTTLARRIPEELLAKIFEHCVVDGWTRAPVIVSHVCSQWRRAASSPRVWSHVYLDGDSTDALGRTRFWLSMAKQAPLHVTVVASWRTPMSYLESCMKLLGRHAEQWEILTLGMDGLRNAWQVATHCTHMMPALRELAARVEVQFDPEVDGESETFALGEVFTEQHAPALQTIALTCNILPSGLTFPTHITNLSLSIGESPLSRPLSAASLFSILEALYCLKQLTLSLPLFYERPFVYEEDPGRDVKLMRLVTLTIYGPTDLNRLLAHLRTPALRQLHLRSLEDLGYRQESVGPTLLQFLQGSNALLELLELHDIDLSPEFFHAMFTALPSLQELRLHESSISDSTLRRLAAPDGFCPQLSRIDLRWCGHLTGKALVDVVRSRYQEADASPDLAAEAVQAEFVPISEVAVLNCCFVEEQDVLDIARMATCRVSLRDDDYCRSRQCCENTRYRQRLRLRHMSTLTTEERFQYKLIV